MSPASPFATRLVACLARLDEEGDRRGVGWYACVCERATDGEPLAVRFPPGVESEGRRITHSRRLVRRGWRRRRRRLKTGDGEGPPAPPVEFFRRDRGDEACAMNADGDGDGDEKSAPGDGDDGDDCGDVATRLAGFTSGSGAVAAGVGREAWVGTAGDQEAWVGTAGDQEAWVGTAGDQEAWVGTAGDSVGRRGASVGRGCSRPGWFEARLSFARMRWTRVGIRGRR